MAKLHKLQDEWTRMIQDLPRDQLPEDAAWYMQDLIPNLGLTPGDATPHPGRLVRRSGFEWASEDLSVNANFSGATYIKSSGYFNKYNRLCFTTDNGKFGYLTPGGPAGTTVTYLTSSNTTDSLVQNYVEFEGKLIIPEGDGTTAPYYYDGTTVGALAGSPPAGVYAGVWKDRALLGGSNANLNRTWFSAIGNPTSWDTTNSWQDTVRPVAGYAVLGNAIMVFHDDATSRIRGGVPPPGGDLVVDDPIFNVGCTFPKTITVHAGNAFFANYQGVYITNGTNLPQDLTAICGVKNTWQRAITAGLRYGYQGGTSLAEPGGEVGIQGGAEGAASAVAGGIFANYYIVTVSSSTDVSNPEASDVMFVFDLATKSCFLFTLRAPVYTMTQTPQVGDELFAGKEAQLFSVSSMFISGGEQRDASGEPIEPVLFTRYYGDTASGKKRWRGLFLDYALQDAEATDPLLNISYEDREYATDVDTSYQVAIGSLLDTDEGSERTSPSRRVRLPLNHSSRGMSFIIQQQNGSSATNIIALLADVYAREESRRG